MHTLLLADDNVTVQRVIALTFAKEPVRVVTASDGHQAMDRVVVDRPDIVLAGTTLPQVNGYDLARFVKGKAGLTHVPVLLLSGAFETIDEAQLKSSGANGVIEKPVEPTTVISRVKELLGITSDGDIAVPAAGRLVTPAGPIDKSPAAPLPTVPRVVTSTRPMPRVESGREPSAAAPVGASQGDDYLDSLESAFDTLDQQIAGRAPTTPASQQRTPPPPVGRAASGDPRSPGKPPAASNGPGNPVYEVDDDWFADRASGEVEPAAPPTPAAPSQPVNEVDDEWFAEDQKARDARELEQRQLAAELGIQNVAVPEVPEVPVVPEVRVVPEVPEVPEVREGPEVREVLVVPGSAEPAAEAAHEPVPRTLPIDWFAMGGSKAERREIAIASVAPIAGRGPDGAPPSAGRVADDFAALLAFERGEKAAPPMIEPTIHLVTPQITPDMLEQIASTVADRLKGSIHVEPRPAEITDEMLEMMAFLVAGTLKDTIRVEPAAPELSAEMLKTIASLMAGHLSDRIQVEPAAPVLTDAIVERMAEMVAERLTGRVHVEPKAPQIDDGMLERIAVTVADRLRDTVRVEAPAPELHDGHLDRMSSTVADRLRDSIHVEAKAPEITDAMLERVSESVAARLRDSIRVEPAIPELNGSMLDQIAATVAARLSDTVRDSVRVETVAPEVTGDMLEHIAHRVSERLTSTVSDRVQALRPAPVPPPQISDEMLDGIAARVAERMQGALSIDGLRDSVTAAIRDTVRSVVSETSERLVREEIERIKAKAL